MSSATRPISRCDTGPPRVPAGAGTIVIWITALAVTLARLGGRPADPGTCEDAPWADAPCCLGGCADDQRDAEPEQQAGPGGIFEDLPAEPADEERVAGPDRARGRGRGRETALVVAGQPAGHGDGGAPAGDEPAADDDAGAVAVEGTPRPRVPAGAL